MTLSTRLSVAILLLAGTACTVQETEIPALTGPSELALRVSMQATPDSILQDGASQSAIQIEASGPDGRPSRGLALRLDILFNGTIQDFGTLSSKTVATGDDGRAHVTYTAPPRASQPVDDFNIITIRATPVGTDFRGEIARTVDVRLVPVGVLLPPNGAPTAKFTISPTGPEVSTNVVFDASQSTDEGGPCGVNCAYNWDFGDGSTATGIFATHQFRNVGTYQVRLTVTDARGSSGTIAVATTVGAGEAPTALFTISPAAPRLGQTIFFNAEASRAALGRRIVSYEWDFGSGRTASGQTVQKSYDTAGTYTVTLTVTDDTGQATTTSQPVTVGGGSDGPRANLTVSAATGTTATDFFFDARASRPLASHIVEYRFTFGDGTTDVSGVSPTVIHRFTAPGKYVVSVTVTDAEGETGVATVNVTVQ